MRNRLFAVLLVLALLTMPGYVAYAESGGVEYAFDLFSIELPERYLVITKDNYQDETLDLGIYEDLLGSYRDSFKQASPLYLAAFDPETAVLLDIYLMHLSSWNDLSVAGEDEINNEIIPEFLATLIVADYSVKDLGFKMLGDQGYVYAQAAFAEDQYLYRYYTMIQTEEGLYGVTITAANLRDGGTDEGADAARAAAQAMNYIGIEGNNISLLTDYCTVSFRLPSYWAKLYDESSNPDSVWWGDVGGNDIMLWTKDVDYWTFYSDEEKALLGYRTRAGMDLTEDGALGEKFLQRYYGDDRPEFEYLHIGGVCFLNSTYSHGENDISMYTAILDGVRYDFMFWWESAGPGADAVIESIMQTVTFAPRDAAQ